MADEEFKEENNAGKASAKNPILTILVLLNTLLMGGVAYFQYTAFQNRSKEINPADIIKAERNSSIEENDGLNNTGEAKKDDGILEKLDTFTANLAQGDGPRRYVRLTAVLKFTKDSSKEEYQARKPQIRDTIISTLNSKRPEDLLKAEGKEFLKEELKSAINTFLVNAEVMDVYYVGFQVQ